MAEGDELSTTAAPHRHRTPTPPLGGGCGRGVETSQGAPTKFLISEKIWVGRQSSKAMSDF